MDDESGLGSMRHWGYFEQTPAMKGSLGLQLMSSVMDRDTKPLSNGGGFLHRDCPAPQPSMQLDRNTKPHLGGGGGFLPRDCPAPRSSMPLDTKPLLSKSGGFLIRDCHVPQPSVPLDFVRDSGWIHHGRDSNGSSKILHILQSNHSHQPNYNVLPDPPGGHTLQMLQHTESMPKSEKLPGHTLQMLQHAESLPKSEKLPGHTLQMLQHTESLPKSEKLPGHTLQMLQDPEPQSKNEKIPVTEEVCAQKGTPSKKRSRGRTQKSPKPKKPKKAATPKDESSKGPRKRTAPKSTAIVISGINLDISGIPTPVCTCTGKPQQCYRWGVGGWQSACCTTSISMYPLPMGTKRRGARISGRKMSQGAFAKVLEKLAGEGYNLSNPIDLKPHWAKHGTNKFVTIR